MATDRSLDAILHITSGESAGAALQAAGIQGSVVVWRDLLYDGIRMPGWPDGEALERRADFLRPFAGGEEGGPDPLDVLAGQYDALAHAPRSTRFVLWFDACLFDQSMLAHVITCLDHLGRDHVELIVVDSFPGIEPYHGLGQLSPSQLASRYETRVPVTGEHRMAAAEAEAAFASQNVDAVQRIARTEHASLSWIAPAATRWLAECPSERTSLGRLETLALEAIRGGAATAGDLFVAVSALDDPPQYWGDTTLWAKVNGLANRQPPLVKILGPTDHLPQAAGPDALRAYTMLPVDDR